LLTVITLYWLTGTIGTSFRFYREWGLMLTLQPLEDHAAGRARSDATNKLTWIVIRKGGLVGDLTVGDCVELTKALQEHHFRGNAGRALFYAMLKKAGVLPPAAPERLRVVRLDGRRSVGQIVDGYGIQCRTLSEGGRGSRFREDCVLDAIPDTGAGGGWHVRFRPAPRDRDRTDVCWGRIIGRPRSANRRIGDGIRIGC
jgi:hypothetical protein